MEIRSSGFVTRQIRWSPNWIWLTISNRASGAGSSQWGLKKLPSAVRSRNSLWDYYAHRLSVSTAFFIAQIASYGKGPFPDLFGKRPFFILQKAELRMQKSRSALHICCGYEFSERRSLQCPDYQNACGKNGRSSCTRKQVAAPTIPSAATAWTTVSRAFGLRCWSVPGTYPNALPTTLKKANAKGVNNAPFPFQDKRCVFRG